jgi:predicted ATP-dependent serine protease
MFAERCPACGRTLEYPLPDRCFCGLELVAPFEAGQGAAERKKLTFKASEVDPLEVSFAPVEASARPALGQGWANHETWLVHGPRGSGKTRLCLRWAATRKVVVLALESGPEMTVAIARSCGAKLRNIIISQDLECWRSVMHRHNSHRLVLDSLGVLPQRRQLSTVEQIHSWIEYYGGTAWVVNQESRRGESRGTAQVDHAVDAVMRVTPAPGGRQADITVTKRRLACLGQATGLRLG